MEQSYVSIVRILLRLKTGITCGLLKFQQANNVWVVLARNTPSGLDYEKNESTQLCQTKTEI